MTPVRRNANRKQNISRNLVRFMNEKGFSQSNLSRRTLVAQPTIIRLISGTGMPNVLVVARLAEALGVNGQKVTVDHLMMSPEELQACKVTATLFPLARLKEEDIEKISKKMLMLYIDRVNEIQGS